MIAGPHRELPDEFDLSLFAPLTPEQIYYFVRAAYRPEFRDRSDEQIWACIALFINSNCWEQPPVRAPLLRDLYTRNDGLIRSHFHKYSLWAQVFPDEWLTFMNYGYYAFDRDSAHELRGAEALFPHAAAMYHHVAAQVDLAGKDVLEIGCGRGGGAAYVARQFSPRSLLATDGTRSNVNFCRRVHKSSARLHFIHALAEELPVDDGEFDAILCIESCKYYAPFSAFAREVHRALRRGGHLLLAFWTALDEALAFQRELASAGLELVRAEDISTQALAAMSLFDGRELISVIDRSATVRARRHYYELLHSAFSVEALASGRARYFVCVFRNS